MPVPFSRQPVGNGEGSSRTSRSNGPAPSTNRFKRLFHPYRDLRRSKRLLKHSSAAARSRPASPSLISPEPADRPSFQPFSNPQIDNGEGPSGTNPHHVPRKQSLPFDAPPSDDAPTSDDELGQPVAAVAEEARVVRTPPIYTVRRSSRLLEMFSRGHEIDKSRPCLDQVRRAPMKTRTEEPGQVVRRRSSLAVPVSPEPTEPPSLTHSSTTSMSSSVNDDASSTKDLWSYKTACPAARNSNASGKEKSREIENITETMSKLATGEGLRSIGLTRSLEPASSNMTTSESAKSSSPKSMKFTQTEETTEGMDEMAIDEKRRRLDVIPSIRQEEWSDFIDTESTSRPDYEAAASAARELLLDEGVAMEKLCTVRVFREFSSVEKKYVVHESKLGGMGMFASKDLPAGTIIAEEKSLVRLLGFDINTTEDKSYYSDIVDTIKHQFGQLVLERDREFLQSLKPFPGTQLGGAEHALDLMRKYGLEVFHPVFSCCNALFGNICRVNHSCHHANAWLSTFGTYQEDFSNGRLTAKRDIRVGEEILIDYTHSAWKPADQMETFRKYRLNCSPRKCDSCYKFMNASSKPVN